MAHEISTSLTRWDQTEQCACVARNAADFLIEVLEDDIKRLSQKRKKTADDTSRIIGLRNARARILEEKCPGDSHVVRRCP